MVEISTYAGENLEEKLKETFEELGISQEEQDSLNTYLDLIRYKDQQTYEHSMRVGLKCEAVAEYLGINPINLFYPGLLHDVGKILTHSNSLKKEDFGQEDMEELKRHPSDGYHLLKNSYPFSAEVVLRHHRHIGEGYPKKLPTTYKDFSEESQKEIIYYSRLLALVDFQDAMFRNNKFFHPDTLTSSPPRKILKDYNKDQEPLIEELYREGIFD